LKEKQGVSEVTFNQLMGSGLIVREEVKQKVSRHPGQGYADCPMSQNGEASGTS
jgi:hypothetical protein